MKTASLSGSLRANVGKKDAASLRASGQVPAVIYGGAEQTHLSIEEIKLSKLVVNPAVFAIDLDIDGKSTKCIIQDVQFHPVTDRIVHVDFLEVIEGKEIKVHLPLLSQGNAKGVIAGGRMETLFRRVPVQGLFENLPEAINADVSNLAIGDNLRVGDLNLEGCKILLNDSVLLFACKRTRAAMSMDSAADAGGDDAEAAEGGEGGKGGEGGEGGEE